MLKLGPPLFCFEEQHKLLWYQNDHWPDYKHNKGTVVIITFAGTALKEYYARKEVVQRLVTPVDLKQTHHVKVVREPEL